MNQKTISTSPLLPACVSIEAWSGFVEMRKMTKKPMTARAELLVLGKLVEMHGKGLDANAALDQSTVQCWAGVFEPKGLFSASGTQQSRAERDSAQRADWFASQGTGSAAAPRDTASTIDMEGFGRVRIAGNR